MKEMGHWAVVLGVERGLAFSFYWPCGFFCDWKDLALLNSKTRETVESGNAGVCTVM